MPKTFRFGVIDGIPNLAIKFDGYEQAKAKIAQLPRLVQRKVLRNSVAAAARPVVKAVKGHAKSISRHSRTHEGVGATARSIVATTKTSKRNPAVAYALVGARRGYFERIHLTKTGRRRGVKSIQTVKRLGRRGGLRKTRLKNIGPSARRARLRPTQGKASSLIRKPTRYLHLLEKGRHKTPKTWPGFGLLVNSARGTRWVSVALFQKTMRAGITRELARIKGVRPDIAVRAA